MSSEEQEAGGPVSEAEAPRGIEERLRGALGDLDELDELPVADHPARFERMHEELRAALSDVDD